MEWTIIKCNLMYDNVCMYACQSALPAACLSVSMYGNGNVQYMSVYLCIYVYMYICTCNLSYICNCTCKCISPINVYLYNQMHVNVCLQIYTHTKKLHFTYAFTFKQYMIICIIYNYIFESGYDIHRLYANDVIVSIIENKQMDIGSMCSYR